MYIDLLMRARPESPVVDVEDAIHMDEAFVNGSLNVVSYENGEFEKAYHIMRALRKVYAPGVRPVTIKPDIFEPLKEMAPYVSVFCRGTLTGEPDQDWYEFKLLVDGKPIEEGYTKADVSPIVHQFMGNFIIINFPRDIVISPLMVPFKNEHVRKILFDIYLNGKKREGLTFVDVENVGEDGKKYMDIEIQLDGNETTMTTKEFATHPYYKEFIIKSYLEIYTDSPIVIFIDASSEETIRLAHSLISDKEYIMQRPVIFIHSSDKK